MGSIKHTYQIKYKYNFSLIKITISIYVCVAVYFNSNLQARYARWSFKAFNAGAANRAGFKDEKLFSGILALSCVFLQRTME